MKATMTNTEVVTGPCFFFFFFLSCIALGILVPHQRRNPRPLQWECRAFTPDHQGSPWPALLTALGPGHSFLPGKHCTAADARTS